MKTIVNALCDKLNILQHHIIDLLEPRCLEKEIDLGNLRFTLHYIITCQVISALALLHLNFFP